MQKISILDKYQVRLLDAIARNKFFRKNFYLTGGTALAEIYLHHRYSEDLDFFSEVEIDILNLDIALKKVTEFTYFPFPRIEKGPLIRGIGVDSLIDIAVNKLFTIYQRTNARDYIDLFCICEENSFKIQELIRKAKAKFDWHIDLLQLGAQFMKAKEIKDFPRMIKKINHKEWQDFFIKEAEKLKKNILK